MGEIGKLSTLLDDPEVRELIFGLAHVGHTGSGPARLHAVLLGLAETTSAEQYGSWLSDDAHNLAMTADQVRAAIGDGPLDDLALFTGGSAGAVAWQLAVVLPDLVDAVSPGGQVVDPDLLGREIWQASADDDRSAGAFGTHVH